MLYYLCLHIIISYMSVRILAFYWLMCRVQTNQRLRHQTITSFTRFGHHLAVTLLTYRPLCLAKLKL